MTIYDELIDVHAKGGDYTAQGVIVPSRRGRHDIVVETDLPAGRRLGVFVNGQFRTLSQVEADGTARASLTLPAGEVEVLFFDDRTQQGIRSYLTVRRTAAIAHAQAEVLTRIEDDIDETQAALGLDGKTRRFLVPYLTRLNVTPPSSYDAEALREIARRLWTAYRRYYGSRLHLQRLSAFSGVEPLLLDQAYRPNWVVGGGLYWPSRWPRRRPFTGSLSALNAAAFDFVHDDYLADQALTFPGPITQPPEAQVLRVNFGAGWDGGAVTIRGQDQSGQIITERVPGVGAPATPSVINTSTKFQTVLGISKQLVGSSTAAVRIGLGTTRRFSIARVGPSLPIGTTYRIGTGPEVLSNDRRISDLAEGRTRIQLDRGQPVSMSSLPEPITVSKSRIRFQIDKGPVQTIRLTPGTLTAADLVTAYSNQLGSAAKATVVFGAPAQGSTTIIPHSGGTSDLTVEWIQTGDPLSPGSDVGAEVNYAGSASQATVTISGLAVGAEDTGIAIEYDDGIAGPLVYQYVWTTLWPPGTSQTFLAALPPIPTGYRTFSGFSTSNPPTSDPSTLIANAINAEAGLPFSAVVDSPTQITLTYDTASSVPNGKEVYNLVRVGSTIYALVQSGPAFATWSGGGTSAPTTPEYAQALIDAIAASTAPLTAALVGADVEITQVSGGASNNGETLSGTSGLTGTFAGGVDATSGSTQTQVGGGGDVAVLSAGEEIRLLPVGDDARFEVFGVPRRTQLSGSVSAGSRLVPVLNAERVYGGSVNVELARFSDDDTAPTFTALPFPTSFELVFDGWTAGDLVLEGTNFDRQLTSETFSPPAGGTGTVVGSVLFRTLTLIEPGAPAAVAAGSVGVRLAGGVETYGQPMRLGRDEALSSSTEVLSWTAQSVSGTALDAAASTLGGRVAWIQIDSGPNEGVHEVFGVSGGNFIVANEFGGNFAPDSVARTWTLLASGEVVTTIGRSGGDVEVSEPLEFGYVAGALAEPDGASTDVVVQSIPDPDAWVDVDVDTRVPQVAGSTYTNLTVEGSVLPDGWQPRNADGVGYATTQGAFGNFPLIIDAPSAGDSSVSFFAGQASYVQGLPVRVTAWIEQVTEDTPQSFTVEISFDNGRTVGSRTRSIARSVVASGAAPFPGAPIRIDAQARVPTNAAPARIRIIWNDAPAGGRWYLHRTIVTAPLQTGYYLGTNTNVRTEHDANFGQVLYYWSPSEPYIAPGDTVPEDNAGIVEASRLLPAHLRWDLFDLSEFDDSTGDAINVRGVYTDVEWDSCTLEGLEVSVALPDKHSSVVPTRLSEQTQDLSIGAPSNATLDVPANIASSDLLPRAPGPNDILFLDGEPVPSASSGATFATATLVGGALTVTCELEGSAANALEVSIVVGAGTVPLAVEVSNIGFSISLAVEEGAPDDEQNRIWTIASLINALDGYSASYAPANENDIVDTAETAFFSGASASPWRYVSDSEIQIDPSELVAGGSYALRYDGLIRATTPVIDLGDDWEDYFWFYDAPKWLRQETRVTEYERTQILEFRGDNTARLDEAANIEADGTLIRDNGIERVQLQNFRFNDQRTVELLATPQNEVLYFFTYTARTGSFVSTAEIELEWRAAPTEAGVASALWRHFESGTPSEPSRWWQLRATFTNVRSLNDCRLYGLGFKGINLYSDEPFAPGMGLRIEDPTLPPLAPPVITFDVVPLNVQDGGPVTISWSIAGTEPMQVELLADSTPVYTGPLVANSLVVNPVWTGDPTQVTYTLTASNADGTTSTSETVIVVPTAPFISVTPGVGPHVIDPNVGTVNVPISWVASGTETIDLVINDGTTDIYTETGIAPTDTITLPFSAAGTYTLTSTVNNPSGIPFTDVDVVVVELGVAPTVITFNISDTSLETGVDAATFTWNIGGSTPVTVTLTDATEGVITTSSNASGFFSWTPSVTGTRSVTLTAVNAFGSITTFQNISVFAQAPFPTLGRAAPGTIHTNDTVSLVASTSSGTPPMTWEVTGDTLGVIASGTWNTKGESDIVTSPVMGAPARFENFTLEVTNAVTTNTDVESVTVENAIDLFPNGAFSLTPQGDSFPLTVNIPSGQDRVLCVLLTYEGTAPAPQNAQLGTTTSFSASFTTIANPAALGGEQSAIIYYFDETQLSAGTTTNQLTFSDALTPYTFAGEWAVHLYYSTNVGTVTAGPNNQVGITTGLVTATAAPGVHGRAMWLAIGDGSALSPGSPSFGANGNTSGGSGEIRSLESIPEATGLFAGQGQVVFTHNGTRVGYCYVLLDPV